MLWIILIFQVVIIAMIVVIYKDQLNFYEATIQKSLQIGKILENRLKHLVEYIDRREEWRMKRDKIEYENKARSGYYGEDVKKEWDENWYGKGLEFEKEWKEREWKPYNPKLYEEED